eukprot:TRINITY_DN51168_c0_g1_i1.p1 TRINITY_DN51168_c0_g1~~TRINITY_DN51168_c0_g1_i1.p1  ORF type:complete len:268 (+),score=84.60 TRINITY_DN51168_c0_g1_i1:99-902(+)
MRGGARTGWSAIRGRVQRRAAASSGVGGSTAVQGAVAAAGVALLGGYFLSGRRRRAAEAEVAELREKLQQSHEQELAVRKRVRELERETRRTGSQVHGAEAAAAAEKAQTLLADDALSKCRERHSHTEWELGAHEGKLKRQQREIAELQQRLRQEQGEGAFERVQQHLNLQGLRGAARADLVDTSRGPVTFLRQHADGGDSVVAVVGSSAPVALAKAEVTYSPGNRTLSVPGVGDLVVGTDSTSGLAVLGVLMRAAGFAASGLPQSA